MQVSSVQACHRGMKQSGPNVPGRSAVGERKRADVRFVGTRPTTAVAVTVARDVQQENEGELTLTSINFIQGRTIGRTTAVSVT